MVAGADHRGARVDAAARALPAARRPARRRSGRRAPTATWQWQLSGPLDLSVRGRGLRRRPLRHAGERRSRGLHARAPARSATSAPGRASGPAGLRSRSGVAGQDARGLARRALARRPRAPTCSARSSNAGSTSARARASTASRPTTSTPTPTTRGFPLRAADQLRFNRFLARAAHARGLAIALKNDVDQAAALAADFDWALVEQCFEYDECERLRPFTAAGKAVWAVEYTRAPGAFCPAARAAGFMAMRQAPRARRGAGAVLVSVRRRPVLERRGRAPAEPLGGDRAGRGTSAAPRRRVRARSGCAGRARARASSTLVSLPVRDVAAAVAIVVGRPAGTRRRRRRRRRSRASGRRRRRS